MPIDVRSKITGEYLSSCKKYTLEPGYIYISRKPSIITTILGSCISVTLFDRVNLYGGMNHYLMASKPGIEGKSSKYGNNAIRALYRSMLDLGSLHINLTARVLGGSHTPCHDLSEKIAQRNISMARAMLDNLGIPIESEDVGGVNGRKIKFYTEFNYYELKRLSRSFDLCSIDFD